MKRFTDLINECLERVNELFPWDLDEALKQGEAIKLLDIREAHEFRAARIAGSINVARGVLESACDPGYEETLEELVNGRDQNWVVICRSGNRSVLAADTLQQMGFSQVRSLKTGLKGWNDYELPLISADDSVLDVDDAETLILKPPMR